MGDATFVVAQVFERHTSHARKLLSCIITAEGRPVVVGAQINVFVGMLAQCRIDIHGFHPGVEMCHHIADGGQLSVGALLGFIRTIELYGCGNHHAIDIHLRAEHLFIFISSLSVAHASLRTAAVCHQGTHFVALAHDDDTRIGYLRILVGIDMILIIINGHAVFGLLAFGCRVLAICASCLFQFHVASLEFDIIIRRRNGNEVLNLHTQCHKHVAIGFAVTEPLRYIAGKRAISQTLPRELREGSQFALFQFRHRTAREGIEDHRKGEENECYDDDIQIMFHDFIAPDNGCKIDG